MSGLQNSIDAYEATTLGRKTRREQVLGAMYLLGKTATSGEIFEYLKANGVQFKTADANIIARLCELRDMEVVRVVGNKTCQSTGQNVQLWEVIEGATPKKLVKKLTHKQEIALRDARIRELEAIIESYQLANRANQ